MFNDEPNTAPFDMNKLLDKDLGDEPSDDIPPPKKLKVPVPKPCAFPKITKPPANVTPDVKVLVVLSVTLLVPYLWKNAPSIPNAPDDETVKSFTELSNVMVLGVRVLDKVMFVTAELSLKTKS